MSAKKHPEELSFNFGWLALKLMGKSLYSNAWSAISELVANGFDAKANNVYVLVDAINRKKAEIEIFDDGDGMTIDDMSTYRQVGFNKREAYKMSNGVNVAPETIMGRKGIGKLAALYLSSSYYVWTRPKNGDESCWVMNFPDKETPDNKNPALKWCSKMPTMTAGAQWGKFKNGTCLKLTNVDLSGAGEQAFLVLGPKLANYFALNSMSKKDIHLCVLTSPQDKVAFSSVKKKVAFGNMAFIAYSPDNTKAEDAPIKAVEGRPQKIPYSRMDGEHVHAIEVFGWDSIRDCVASGVYDSRLRDENGEQIRVPYRLKGWIGIHCTINKSGCLNDKDFANNRFYNPSQLRLYVRNKLAVENFLNVLNNTQTYVNYIEGEIHFDLLDDDRLPDIATANRQGVDEHDARVELLCSILKPIVRALINKRTALASQMKDEMKQQEDARKNAAKSVFVSELTTELAQCEHLTSSEQSELATLITNKIEGDVTIKKERVIFFSHSSFDKHFGDFFHKLLIERGVMEDEVFYTSRDDDPDSYADVHPLADQIKKCMTKENTLLFYLIGYKYSDSQYCLFEGGAGWATRAIGTYPVLAVKYEHIPKFLTNGKTEMALYDPKKKCVPLERNNYLKIVTVLNRLIEHINNGRRCRNEAEVKPFLMTQIPSKHQLVRMGKKEEDFMEPQIKEFWKVYVAPELKAYVRQMNRKKGKRR